MSKDHKVDDADLAGISGGSEITHIQAVDPPHTGADPTREISKDEVVGGGGDSPEPVGNDGPGFGSPVG
jgi:hypothetical protein